MVLVNLSESELTDQQKYAIDLLVGRTPTGNTMTKTAIAAEVGVSRQALYDWMKKPEFRRELVAQAKTVTDSGMAKGVTWMDTALEDPNVKDVVKVQIVKLFMQSKGMLKDVQETTVVEKPKVAIDDLMKHYGIEPKE